MEEIRGSSALAAAALAPGGALAAAACAPGDRARGEPHDLVILEGRVIPWVIVRGTPVVAGGEPVEGTRPGEAVRAPSPSEEDRP